MTSNSSPGDQGFPKISEPFVNIMNGIINRSWRQLLITLWQRTGGSGGTGTVISGTVIDFAGPVIPAGWLLCDGSAVSRSTFSILFGVIGTAWGPGDGFSTFNLPNLASRFTRGGDASELGQHGGATHLTLTVAQLPAHNHTVDDPGHTHVVTDPGHTHAVTDPGHTHVVDDPEHTHAVTDPGHVHAITDPGHHHTALTATSLSTTGAVAGTSTAGDTGDAMTGITIDSAVTGLANQDAATGVTNEDATTGVTNEDATTGVTNADAVTGVTTEDTGAGAAIDVNPPYAVMLKLIKS